MKLSKLIKLRRKLKNTDQLVKIRMIIEYFDLAQSSYEIYCKYLQKWVEQDQKELKSKALASIYGFYSSGKICTLIAQDINKQIKTSKDINQIRNKYKNWAIHFVDFRNDFGAHPLNKKVGCYSHVVGFANQNPKLTVEIRDIKKYNVTKIYYINPNEDIKKLHKYLEELAEIYETQWANI